MLKNNPSTIVLASSNPGKLKEFQNLLHQCGFTVKPQAHYQVSDAEETGLSFVENALLKARNACKHTQLPSIADDSGLEVDALNGAPGIYSARFSGPNATDAENNHYLIAQLSDIPAAKRTARYQCVLVYMQHALDPTPIICQGSWEGLIVDTPAGANGFGYDPHFFVPTHQCTSAELEKAVKNAISHRAIAMKSLLEQLIAEAG